MLYAPLPVPHSPPLWNRSLASVALRAPWITTESSFGRGAIRARPGGIDDVEPPRRTLGTRRCRGHDKRSPRLRRLEIEPEGVAGRHRVPFNPLNLPVRVAPQSSRGRGFACASSMYLRSSKPPGLSRLHIAAYSRSAPAGRSKMAIVARRSGAARRVDTSMSASGRHIST